MIFKKSPHLNLHRITYLIVSNLPSGAICTFSGTICTSCHLIVLSVLLFVKTHNNFSISYNICEVSPMKYLKRYTIIGIIFVLITGTLAHFLYDWTGNNDIVGLFVPINESIWEHIKLLFFPMLIYSLILIFKFRKTFPCITSALCFGILAGTMLIPILFYTYTAIIGKDIFFLDISTFIISIILAFWLSYKLTLSCKLEPYTFLLCCFVCILFICFILFTYRPPKAQIFAEPTVSESYSLYQ